LKLQSYNAAALTVSQLELRSSITCERLSIKYAIKNIDTCCVFV